MHFFLCFLCNNVLKTILNKLHQNTLLQFLDLFYFEFVYNAFWPLHDIPLSVMTSSLIYGSGVQSNSWKNSFSVIYFFFILVDVVIFYYLKRYFITKICYFAELHSSSILYASLTTLRLSWNRWIQWKTDRIVPRRNYTDTDIQHFFTGQVTYNYFFKFSVDRVMKKTGIEKKLRFKHQS